MERGVAPSQMVQNGIQVSTPHNGCQIADNSISSAWIQKGLTGYCFKYIDRPLSLQTDDL